MAKAAKVGTKLSKGGLITAITESVGEGTSRKQVKAILETLTTIGYKELKKNGSFVVPGFAKYVVVKKPATPAREGINPFTGEKMMFKAKPASKKVRVMPLKSLKAMVNS